MEIRYIVKYFVKVGCVFDLNVCETTHAYNCQIPKLW